MTSLLFFKKRKQKSNQLTWLLHLAPLQSWSDGPDLVGTSVRYGSDRELERTARDVHAAVLNADLPGGKNNTH